MSRDSLRRFAWLKAAAPLCGLIAVAPVALSISCDPNDDSEPGLDKYFLRDVTAMQELGLPVYWLGTEFTVDDHVFRGPYVSEFGAEVEGGGIQMDYVTAIDGANIGPVLTVYSRGAWDLVKDGVNAEVPGVTHRVIRVGDRDGEMILQADATRPLNAISLVLDLGDVVVVARTNSVIGATPWAGSDMNPIIDNPDLLIRVMEDLRPYPE